MTDAATLDRTAELERKIDALTEQVQFLTEEAVAQAKRRRSLEELQADLTPIAMQAIELSSKKLDDVHIDPSALIQLGLRVAENAETLDKAMIQLQSMADLASDMMPIVDQGVAKLIDLADEFEQRGYFEFAGAGLGVIDRIVTGYSKEDVEALGDNVVNMLDIIKDLTQPEMLAMAERVLEIVQKQADTAADDDQPAPGLFALMGKVRDPEIRRGLGRALDTFKAVTAGDVEERQPMEAAETTEADTNTNDTPGGA